MGKLSRKFQPTTGASKTRALRKFTKSKLKDVKRDPEDWIAKMGLLRGDL